MCATVSAQCMMQDRNMKYTAAVHFTSFSLWDIDCRQSSQQSLTSDTCLLCLQTSEWVSHVFYMFALREQLHLTFCLHWVCELSEHISSNELNISLIFWPFQKNHVSEKKWNLNIDSQDDW